MLVEHPLSPIMDAVALVRNAHRVALRLSSRMRAQFARSVIATRVVSVGAALWGKLVHVELARAVARHITERFRDKPR